MCFVAYKNFQFTAACSRIGMELELNLYFRWRFEFQSMLFEVNINNLSNLKNRISC